MPMVPPMMICSIIRYGYSPSAKNSYKLQLRPKNRTILQLAHGSGSQPSPLMNATINVPNSFPPYMYTCVRMTLFPFSTIAISSLFPRKEEHPVLSVSSRSLQDRIKFSELKNARRCFRIANVPRIPRHWLHGLALRKKGMRELALRQDILFD